MPVIGVYARASRDKDDKRISVDRQVERCTHLAGELWPGEPVLVFEDNAASGADPDVERPGYNAFVDAVRRGDLDEIVCHEQSRLTRQPTQWEELVVTLTRAGIAKVHTVQSGVVPVDAGNRLLGRIMAIIDAEEVERLKARQRAASAQIRAEGRPGGGPSPYGFRRGSGPDGRPVYEIDDDQAAVIREISDAICDGRSLQSIAAGLTRRAVPSPSGPSPWNPTVIRAMVGRPSLAGFRTRSVKEKGKGERHEIVGPARWDPILTESRWRQTLDMLGTSTVTGADGKTHTVRRQQPGRPRRWLLTNGLARCARCGSKLVVMVSGEKGSLVFRCHPRTGCGKVGIQPAEAVEAWVHGQLVEYLASNPKLPPALTSEDPERGRLEEERRHAERDMIEAVILKRDGEIDETEFRVMHSGAKKRREQTQAELDARPVPETAVPDVDAIRDRWEQLPLARKQKALAHYIETVTVHPATGNHLDWTQHERFAARIKITWKA
jgi:DNA invertase Pin-like site-specific DNA recombinase